MPKFYNEVLINKLKKNFFGGKEPEKGDKPYLSAQGLLDYIFSEFKERLEEETTEIYLLFPTCFYIYLHQSDYEERKEGFGHAVSGIVNMFHDYIRKKMMKYPDYIPHATYWRVQFLPIKDSMFTEDKNGKEITVKQKEPFIISTIYSTNISKGNFGSENFTATRRDSDSRKVEKYNVNPRALIDVERVGDCFTVKFDKSFEKIRKEIYSDDRNNMEQFAIAFLTITIGKFFGVEEEKNKYSMTSNELYISGKNDDRTNLQILKIDNERVLNPHIHIKYNAGVFKIAAFGDVLCSERPITLSKGSEILWFDLINNTDIFINREININFKINKQ